MAKLKFKVSRRVQENIWQTKKLTLKQKSVISLLKKNTNRKQSDFSKHLQHMKKLSIFYGNFPRKKMERLTATYLDKYKSLLRYLETRLDVILVRIHFCSTLFAARQLISHRKVCVNSSIVDIPGYSLSPGDVISISDDFFTRPKVLCKIKENLKYNKILSKPNALLKDVTSQGKPKLSMRKMKAVYPVTKPNHVEVNYKIGRAVLLFDARQIQFPYTIERASLKFSKH